MLSRRRLEALSGGRDCHRRLIYRPRVTSARTANGSCDWPPRGGVRTHWANAAAPRLALGERGACAGGGPGSARGGACAVRGLGRGRDLRDPRSPPGSPPPPPRPPRPQNPPGTSKIPLGHPPPTPRPTKYPHEPQNAPRDHSNTSKSPWDSPPKNRVAPETLTGTPNPLQPSQIFLGPSNPPQNTLVPPPKPLQDPPTSAGVPKAPNTSSTFLKSPWGPLTPSKIPLGPSKD